MRHQGLTKGIESRWICKGLFLAFLLSLPLSGWTAVGPKAPTNLRSDSLTEPLGIDSPNPSLSWRLQDPSQGAKQTAYEIFVYSKKPADDTAKPDVWDSGRVSSGTSTGVPYGGPPLQLAKRYFWRVEVWDKEGKPYPISDITWWETGLLSQSNWQGKWIGYEEADLHSVRESGAAWITNSANHESEPKDTHHDFRFAFSL